MEITFCSYKVEIFKLGRLKQKVIKLAYILQIKALPAGLDNIILVDDEVRQKTFAVGSQGGGGVDTSGRKWKPGELEFEALMRQLDNAVRTSI